MRPAASLFKKLFTMLLLAGSFIIHAQQSLRSVLINHGAHACNSAAGEQQFFTGLLTSTPTILQTCNNGLTYYSVLAAYNPKDKKIYFADVSSGTDTKMYALDYNFAGVITCQQAVTPDYTYNYSISQLCFDQDGNNLIIYNYNSSAGVAGVKRIDVTNGADIAGTDKVLDFPPGNTPNSLDYGDIVFMPNGRVFMTFGNTPSKLFELVNFDGPGDATAVFLTDIPRACFSIGYVDGSLLVAGADTVGCYYYTWDIYSQVLSNSYAFPLGKSTADITHMNVGVGAAQELIGGTIVNSNTADIIYHVYLKNKGNIDISNVQLKNKLTDAFGAGNVSNVQISFVSNPAGLVLNPNYDGMNDIDLLLAGQNISNYPVSIDSAVIRVQLRATNLILNNVYYSSTTMAGQTGAGANIMQVSDSSNNGNAALIDPNANGVSDDIGEGIPTPFVFNVLLPVANIVLTGTQNKENVQLVWKTNDEQNLESFDIERSTDGTSFIKTISVAARKTVQSSYLETDNIAALIAQKIFYRLKINDNDGKYFYSNIIIVTENNTIAGVSVYPNPFTSILNIQTKSSLRTAGTIMLFDGTGKLIRQLPVNFQPGNNYSLIDNLKTLSKGVYCIEVINGDKKTEIKLIK